MPEQLALSKLRKKSLVYVASTPKHLTFLPGLKLFDVSYKTVLLNSLYLFSSVSPSLRSETHFHEFLNFIKLIVLVNEETDICRHVWLRRTELSVGQFSVEVLFTLSRKNVAFVFMSVV